MRIDKHGCLGLQEYNRNKERVRRVVVCIAATKPPHPECKTCYFRRLCLNVRPRFNREKMTLLLDDAMVIFAKCETEGK